MSVTCTPLAEACDLLVLTFSPEPSSGVEAEAGALLCVLPMATQLYKQLRRLA